MKKTWIPAFAGMTTLLLIAVPAFAQSELSNPLGNTKSIPQVIGLFIRFIIGFVGSGALLMFVWGGLKFIMAAGNDKEVAEAKNIMTWATYGLLIIFFAFAIVTGITGALTTAGTAGGTR